MSDEYDDWMDMFVATANRFQEENEDLEAILAGDVGLHAYFVADGDDPTRGVHTAILQAVYEATEEIHVDADLVEHNQGEVIP